MEPKYNIGEVVICKEVDPSTINIGDSIVYKGLTGSVSGKIILHDVVEIENKDGEIIFHAKGLANDLGDPDISPSQIYGICVHESYLLTLIYALATSNYASAIIFTFLALNVFLAFRSKKVNYKKLPDNIQNYNVDLNNIPYQQNNNIPENFYENYQENYQGNYQANYQETYQENVNNEIDVNSIYAKIEKINKRIQIEKENKLIIEEEIKRRLKKK